MSHRGLGFLGVCFGLVVVLMILNPSTLSGSLGNGIQPAVTQPPVIVVTETITKTVTKFVGVTETVTTLSLTQSTMKSTVTATYTYTAEPSPSSLPSWFMNPYGLLLTLLVGLTLGYGLSFITRFMSLGYDGGGAKTCTADHDVHTPPVKCNKVVDEFGHHEGDHYCPKCGRPFT